MLRVNDPIYRKGLEALPAHVAVLDAGGFIVVVNRAWTAFGDSQGAKGDPGVAVGADYLAVCRQAATQDPLAKRALLGIEAVLNGQIEEFTLEYPCHGPSERCWFLMTVTPLDRHERIGAVISHTDITARITADRERQAADARYRAIYENAPVGIAELTPAGRWVCANDRFRRILGYEARELELKLKREFTHADDLEAEGALMEVLRSGSVGSVALEKRMRRKDGAFVWVRSTTSCIRAPDGGVENYVIAIEDISERRQAEARQQTLMHEVAHRGKNLLAVIQSIASSSLRGTGSLDDARRAFEGRLQALSKTFDTLTNEAFSGAPLDVVLSNELSAFGGRVKWSGTSVILAVKAAQTFALVAHELATNASKYGALSAPEGQIRIQWEVVGPAEEERLKFEWREEGGPPAPPPRRQGFGSMLIMTVAGAEFGCKPEVSYTTAGFAYRFDAPLKKLGTAPSETRVRSKLKSDVTRALYEEWARCRGASGALPRLDEFDWRRFAPTGVLAVARIDRDGRPQLIQIGRGLVEELGGPSKERELTEEEQEGLLAAYGRCASKGEPCHEYLHCNFGDGEPVTFERLIVPFSAGAVNEVTHVAAAVVFGGQTRLKEP